MGAKAGRDELANNRAVRDFFSYIESFEPRVAGEGCDAYAFDDPFTQDALRAARRGVTDVLRNDRKTGLYDRTLSKLMTYHRRLPIIAALVTFALCWIKLSYLPLDGTPLAVGVVCLVSAVVVGLLAHYVARSYWSFVDFLPKLDREDIKETRRKQQEMVGDQIDSNRQLYFQKARDDHWERGPVWITNAWLASLLKWDVETYLNIQYLVFEDVFRSNHLKMSAHLRIGAALVVFSLAGGVLLRAAYVDGGGLGFDLSWSGFLAFFGPLFAALSVYWVLFARWRRRCIERVAYVKPMVSATLAPDDQIAFFMDENGGDIWNWAEREPTYELARYQNWLCAQFRILRGHKDTPT
ncbi:MAG: hypothetical protein ACFB00_09180 [Parvularculaceae bacterium]